MTIYYKRMIWDMHFFHMLFPAYTLEEDATTPTFAIEVSQGAGTQVKKTCSRPHNQSYLKKVTLIPEPYH